MAVTGASGFLGSHLVGYLVAGGHHVVGIDWASPRGGSSEAVYTNLPGLRGRLPPCTHRLDITSDALVAALTGCSVVFHLAALTGVRRSWGPSLDAYMATNILGTHRVLLASKEAGVKHMVLASSSSVYGPAGRPSQESDVLQPLCPYGVTKAAAEQLCFAYTGSGLAVPTVAAVRLFTVYGPGQRPDMVVGRILAAASQGTPVEIFGDGSQLREYTYVSDAVAGLTGAAFKSPGTGITNIGGGQSVSLTDLIALASEVAERKVQVSYREAKPGDVPSTSADHTRARATLGYLPVIGLKEGLQREYDWLQNLKPTVLQAFLTSEAPRE